NQPQRHGDSEKTNRVIPSKVFSFRCLCASVVLFFEALQKACIMLELVGTIIDMKTPAPETEVDVWMRILHPEKELPPRAARAILELSFPEEDVSRMHELSAKARAGTLSSREESEIETFERVGAILSTLKSKARQVLKRGRRGA